MSHYVPSDVPSDVPLYVPSDEGDAASPLPAKAASAASRRQDAERAAAIGKLLRDGKLPEQIAAETGEPLEYVLSRKALRDKMPLLPQRRRQAK